MKIKKFFFKLNLLLILLFNNTILIYSNIKPYDQIINKLNGYFNEYNSNDHLNFLKFLKEDLANYPTADNGRSYISNPDTQAAWINGTDQWKNKGFKNYIDKINILILKYSDNIQAIDSISNFIIEQINLMQDPDLKKIIDNEKIKEIQDRVTEYIKAIDISNIKIKQQIENNLDTTKTFLTGDSNGGYLDTYRRLNEELESKLNNFNHAIIQANKKIQKIYSRSMKKLKNNT